MNENISRKDLYWFCIASGVSGWLIDSILEVYLYRKSDIIHQIFAPDINELLVRLTYIVIIVVIYFFLKIRFIDQSSEKGIIDKEICPQLTHANHMTILGSLVNGTVHDFKNPNSVIASNAPLLMEIWSDLEKILQECKKNQNNLLIGGLEYNDAMETVPLLLNGINESAKKMDTIIEGLREFSSLRVSPVDSAISLNPLIIYSTSLLTFGICRSVENLEMNLSPDLPSIKGSKIYVVIIIMNLLQNAISSLNTSSGNISIMSTLKNGGKYVIMKISDNGRGMVEGELHDLFQPFNTTFRKDKNLGLGLFTINNILQELKGTIDIKSQPNIGTTITIEFPVFYG